MPPPSTVVVKPAAVVEPIAKEVSAGEHTVVTEERPVIKGLEINHVHSIPQEKPSYPVEVRFSVFVVWHRRMLCFN